METGLPSLLSTLDEGKSALDVVIRGFLCLEATFHKEAWKTKFMRLDKMNATMMFNQALKFPHHTRNLQSFTRHSEDIFWITFLENL
jgi:hypothetical protein